MRIDSHQHFWVYDPVRDSWIDDDMRVIRKDFLPQNLAPILDANKIDGCIAVQADQSEEETNFLLDFAEKNEFIKGVVGWVNLCDDNIQERLEHFTQNSNFKGVRHILQAENEDFVLRKDFQNGIKRLQKFGLTYDILIFPNQLKNTIELVKAFPEQKFVLDHLAKPDIKTGKITEWEASMRKLAIYENVYCKVSGMITEADWTTWKAQDFNPYLDVVFDTFGTRRTLFGSDWPVCLLAGEYSRVLGLTENYLQQFSKEEQNLVMGGNACNFYDLT